MWQAHGPRRLFGDKHWATPLRPAATSSLAGGDAMRELAVESSALISDDGIYRYLLRRHWSSPTESLGWIMLNPSTADATTDDPTVRRCMGFARRWGFGGIAVANLFALRATDPAALKSHPDPVGPDNDDLLTRMIGNLHVVMVAWGAHAGATGRVRALMASRVPPPQGLMCLGTTKGGQPRHPLYVKADARPIPWNPSCP